jgi:hypothetical protein
MNRAEEQEENAMLNNGSPTRFMISVGLGLLRGFR